MNKKQILSFGAHPDDIEIGCAGTEYNLIQSGFEATHVYITSGEAGSKNISKSKLVAIREKEALESAKILGVKSVEFLRCHDGLTSFAEDTRTKVINLIRKIKPEIIFVHGVNLHKRRNLSFAALNHLQSQYLSQIKGRFIGRFLPKIELAV